MPLSFIGGVNKTKFLENSDTNICYHIQIYWVHIDIDGNHTYSLHGDVSPITFFLFFLELIFAVYY